MLTLNFHNVSSPQGVAQEMWQAMLWIEADFVVKLPEGLLVSESHWCVVELAVRLATWLRMALAQGPEFVYTSMDDEQEGLLWFRLAPNGDWLVGSAWQQCEGTSPIAFAELQRASRLYVARVLQASTPYLSPQLAQELDRVCA